MGAASHRGVLAVEEPLPPPGALLVRFDGNNFSVPVRGVHRASPPCESTVRVYREEQLVAEHRRIWANEAVSFDPVHYPALLERKPEALDFTRPPRRLGVAPVLRALRLRLEAAHGSEGTPREYTPSAHFPPKARDRRRFEFGLVPPNPALGG